VALGRLLGYVYDRESANFSRSDLASLLRTTADNPPDAVATLEQAPGVVVLDLSALQTSDRLNDSKFATSPGAVRLLDDRLIAGQGLDGSEAGVANAADASGGVIGGVAAAPIVLFTDQGGR